MRTSKRLLAAVMIGAFVAPGFIGCKKGEGDPFLSLKSRKSRVAGEWTIDNFIQELTMSGSSTSGGSTDTYSGTSTMEIEGDDYSGSSSMTQTSSGSSTTTSTIDNGSATATITFEKDGTFTRVMELKNVTSTTTTSGGSYTETVNQTEEASGTWNFLGGVEEDFKSKERIILNIQSVEFTQTISDADGNSMTETDTYTYANGEYSEIWQLTTLKSKEMMMEGTISNSGSSTWSYNFFGFSDSGSDSSEESGTVSATLTQE